MMAKLEESQEMDERRRTTLTDEDLDHIVKHVNKVGVRLSDDDVNRIALALESQITKRFYMNLGKGLWAMVWKGIILFLLAMAAYGHYK